MELNGADLSGEELPDARTCPNTQHLFPEKVRRPLRNLVDGVCPRKEFKRRLKAVDFQVFCVGLCCYENVKPVISESNNRLLNQLPANF